MSEEAAWRAAAKYGNAIAHVTLMYRHLVSKNIPFELEVSVDETETPTSHAEHIFIVSELKRLGVQWVSLAPRYVGRFEKGVDYIGDLESTGNRSGRARGDCARVWPVQIEPAFRLGQVQRLSVDRGGGARHGASEDGGHKLS